MTVNKPLDVEKVPAEPRTKVLSNGVVLDLDKGRFIAGGNVTNKITKENATEFHRARQEKTKALLRDRIIKAHNQNMPWLVKTSSGAFAEAGTMRYEVIGIQCDAYPRDRMEAWSTLGKAAGVLSDPREPASH